MVVCCCLKVKHFVLRHFVVAQTTVGCRSFLRPGVDHTRPVPKCLKAVTRFPLNIRKFLNTYFLSSDGSEAGKFHHNRRPILFEPRYYHLTSVCLMAFHHCYLVVITFILIWGRFHSMCKILHYLWPIHTEFSYCLHDREISDRRVEGSIFSFLLCRSNLIEESLQNADL